MGLVEIVDVEDLASLRRGEGAKVQQMTVAAHLHAHAGDWRPGQDEIDVGLLAFGRAGGAGGFDGHGQLLTDFNLVRWQLVLRLQRLHRNLEALADGDQFVTLDSEKLSS